MLNAQSLQMTFSNLNVSLICNG